MVGQLTCLQILDFPSTTMASSTMTEWPLNKCTHPVVDGETMCGRQHVPYPFCGSRVALMPHTLTPDTKLMEAPGGPGGTLELVRLSWSIFTVNLSRKSINYGSFGQRFSPKEAS